MDLSPSFTGPKRNHRINSEIAIAGAGIAGMTAALALAKYNIPSIIYERTSALQEVGAGIQLAPNATRLLGDLGLLDALSPYICAPDFINLSDADNGRPSLHLPIKEFSVNHWHFPYLTIHRADMQKALKREIDKNPLVKFVGGSPIETVSGNAGQGFKLHFSSADNTGEKQAEQLLCCDGVWSRLRAAYGEKSQFSSYIAWRATMAKEDLPQELLAGRTLNSVSAYMSRDSHFIIYPLRKGAFYNFVVLTKGADIGQTWSHKGDKNKLLSLFNGKSELLRALIEQTPEWTFWPLFQMPFPRFLGENGSIFLGDASHAVTPFAAQGAAMAIEDACACAKALADMRSAAGAASKKQIFSHFDKTRQERLRLVAKRGDFNRFVYHLSGPMALARNMVMRLRPQKSFLKDLDWLYGYNALAPLTEPRLRNS